MERERQPSDAERIEAGIADAALHERVIDVATARLIASQLHDGQWTHFYSFASTGHLDVLGMLHEITVGPHEVDEEVVPWYQALITYIYDHYQQTKHRDEN